MNRHSLIGSTARNLAIFALFAISVRTLSAAEVIPPKPAGYFNDYAGVVSRQAADQLNEQLAQFERETSSQIVVAVYPKMQSDSSIDDYGYRVGRAWDVGQKGKNNGAVLLVFIQDRQMTIQTGYGLEGALPDILCKQIIDNEIKPRFKQGDYTGGLTAGVNTMMAAARGEYKGAGSTHTERQGQTADWVFWAMLVVFLIRISLRKRGGTYYSGRGTVGGGWYFGGFGGGGGYSSGGGFSGFSGGGGSFGGGGASGSW
jgi:uncharacterized protein